MIIKATPNQSEKHRAYIYYLILSKSQVSTNNYETVTRVYLRFSLFVCRQRSALWKTASHARHP